MKNENNAGNANSGMSGSVMFDLAKILMGSAQSAASQGGFGDLVGSVWRCDGTASSIVTASDCRRRTARYHLRQALQEVNGAF
ncbi:MAG: hypothetical protein U0T81_00435 [Saprospiraceae bacterium]